MEMKKIRLLLALVLGVSFSGRAQILRSAGTLLVDVSADTITANDGDVVAQWANGGTLGGTFAAVTNNAGVSFTNNIFGKKAVLFRGIECNALTNSVATPASLTGNSAWSMEAWVWVDAVPSAKAVYLSWTEHGAADMYDPSRLMFRYDNGNVAVDNLNGTVGYGYGLPAAGAWHHMAVVRNTFKQEKVFVDGNAVAFSWCAAGVQSGIPLSLGAVKKYSAASYTNFFRGPCRVCVSTQVCSPIRTCCITTSRML